MKRAVVLVFCASCTCAPEPRREDAQAEAVSIGERPPRHEDTHARTSPPPERAAPPSGPREFGARIDATRPLTPLTTIIAAPGEHAERVVRTRGVVHRVCQRMGCWMELRDGDGPAVRVPMAGHAFFLPRDCEGQPAEVEGRVMIQELAPEARAHLGSEGATALASTLSIHATGVRLDP